MISLRNAPGTQCPELDAGQGHYVYPYISRWPLPAQGYCDECGMMCQFIEHPIVGTAGSTMLWTEYHYPITEWP